MGHTVKGTYRATPDTLNDGGSTDLRTDNRGVLLTKDSGAATGTVAVGADAVANPTLGGLFSYLMGFNGTTWDRLRTAIVAKTATFTGLLNTLPLGRYNASPASLTDGDVQLLQLDSAGNLRAKEMFAPGAEDNTNNVIDVQLTPIVGSTASCSSSDTVAAASAVVKASAGRVYKVVYYNDNAATRYFQIFNSTTVPADTAVPLLSFPVLTKTGIQIDWNYGKVFSVGIAVCNSTTAATKTVGGADGNFNVEYK